MPILYKSNKRSLDRTDYEDIHDDKIKLEKALRIIAEAYELKHDKLLRHQLIKFLSDQVNLKVDLSDFIDSPETGIVVLEGKEIEVLVELLTSCNRTILLYNFNDKTFICYGLLEDFEWVKIPAFMYRYSEWKSEENKRVRYSMYIKEDIKRISNPSNLEILNEQTLIDLRAAKRQGILY